MPRILLYEIAYRLFDKIDDPAEEGGLLLSEVERGFLSTRRQPSDVVELNNLIPLAGLQKLRKGASSKEPILDFDRHFGISKAEHLEGSKRTRGMFLNTRAKRAALKTKLVGRAAGTTDQIARVLAEGDFTGGTEPELNRHHPPFSFRRAMVKSTLREIADNDTQLIEFTFIPKNLTGAEVKEAMEKAALL
jgi:hypothetical protein